MSIETRLRKVGGSTMVAIPPALLEALALAPNSAVSMDIVKGGLMIAPSHITPGLADLIAQCDPHAPYPRGDKAWVAGRPVGKELI